MIAGCGMQVYSENQMFRSLHHGADSAVKCNEAETRGIVDRLMMTRKLNILIFKIPKEYCPMIGSRLGRQMGLFV